MALERLTVAVKSALGIGESQVDRLVGDYRTAEKVSRVLGSAIWFEPEDIVEVARQRGVLTEEEIQDYIERTQQHQG